MKQRSIAKTAKNEPFECDDYAPRVLTKELSSRQDQLAIRFANTIFLRRQGLSFRTLLHELADYRFPTQI